MSIVCAAVCQTTTSFVHTSTKPTTMRSTTAAPPLTFSSPLQATAREPSTTKYQQQLRQTPQEQANLLQLAVEARRIRALQKQAPTLKQLAAASGYDGSAAVQAALNAGQAARESLVTQNVGLVHYCVQDILKHQRFSSSLSREDLVQEGAIGLARAVDRWNPEIGGRFSTYAVYWIRALVLRCIAERDDMVRVPEHMQAAVRKVSRAAKRLGLDIDNETTSDGGLMPTSSSSSWKEAPMAKALAEEAGLSDKQVLQAIRVRSRRKQGVMSFESWMQQGKDYETDTAAFSAEPEEPLVKIDDLKKTLSRFLRPREMEALSWRYGLNKSTSGTQAGKEPKDYVAGAEEYLFGDGEDTSNQSSLPVRGKWGEDMSFVEVGKRMKVSAEYGRRLCHKALEKLRQAAEEGALEPALLY